MNSAAKRALIREIPQEARPMAKAMAHMDSELVASIVTQLPELTKALEFVTQKQSGESQAVKAERLEAAKKIYRVFKEIPPKAREQMAEILPEEVRGAAQIADGIAEDDIEIVLRSIDDKSGQGAGGNADDEDVDDLESGKKKKSEEQKEREKMIDGAKVVLRAEVRRLWQWVLQGPLTLRVLTFLCGISMIASGAVGFWIQIFNKFRIFAIGSNVYIFLAGFLVSSLEIKSVLCTTYVRSQVYNFFHFLSLMKGRGAFLLFFALFNFAIIDTTTRGWTELLNIISGILCFSVGIYTLVAGLVTERMLKSAKYHIKNREEILCAFDNADEFGEGKLSPEEIINLLQRLDPPTILTNAELMAAMNLMDLDHNGYVEREEFLNWYDGDVSQDSADVPTSLSADETSAQTQNIKKTCFEHFIHGLVSSVTTIALAVVCVGSVCFYLSLFFCFSFSLSCFLRAFLTYKVPTDYWHN